MAHAWIGRFDRAGQRVWLETILPSQGAHGRVDGLVTDGHNGCWALIGDGASPQLAHFDEHGQTDGTIDLAAAVDVPLAVYTLEYGDTHLGFADSIRALGRSPTQIGFAATVSTTPNFDGDTPIEATTDIVFGRFDLQGHELGRMTWSADPETPLARMAEDVVFEPPNRWFIAGSHVPRTSKVSNQLWLGRVEPAPTWSWTSYSVLGEQAGAVFGGLVVDEGKLLVAGGVYRDPDNATLRLEAWIAGMERSGEPLWRAASTMPGYETNGVSSLRSCVLVR